jgi:formiminotetrahydrofolate cyclodeaminase
MNRNYIWQTAYLAAVYETDDEMMKGRILEARAAIEQRLLVPVEQDSPEYREIVAARKALEVLKSERVDKIERPHTFASASSQPAYVSLGTVRCSPCRVSGTLK